MLLFGRLRELVDQRRHFLARRHGFAEVDDRGVRGRVAGLRACARSPSWPSAVVSVRLRGRDLGCRRFVAFLRSGETTSSQPAAEQRQHGDGDRNDAIAAGHRALPLAAWPRSSTRRRRVAVATAAFGDGVGSGSKVIVAPRSTGAEAGQPPVVAGRGAAGALVELCSVDVADAVDQAQALSVRATSAWLVAQPVSVNVGTLPGGVAEATADAPAWRCGRRGAGARARPCRSCR